MHESLKEDGKPSQQWYWDDWFSEFGLRACSLPARGLWMDMLGIMFSSEIRGTFLINGEPVNNKTLQRITGASMRKITKLLQELEKNKVFSRLPNGTIINRRMYRNSLKQREISDKRSEAGRKGMESRWHQNNNKGITSDNNKIITKITAPSSSPSPTPTPSSKSIYPPQFEKFWNSYPRKEEKKNAYCTWKQLNKGQQEEVIVASPNYAIAVKTREKDFIKYPKSFLNPKKEIWKGYLEAPKQEETWLDKKLKEQKGEG